MNIFRGIFKNSLLAMSGSIVMKGVNALMFILIARSANPEWAGIFSLSTSYLAVLITAALGLDELLIRQIVRNRSQEWQHLISFAILRIIVIIAEYLLLGVLLFSHNQYNPVTIAAIRIFSLCLIPESVTAISQAYLMSKGQFLLPNIGALISGLLRIIMSAAILWHSMLDDLQILGWIWLIGSIINSLICLGGLAANLAPAQRSCSDIVKRTLENLKLSRSFLLIGVILAVEYQIEVIILSMKQPILQVSLYTAAFTITFAITIISQSFRAAIYPVMVQYHKTDQDQLRRVYDFSFYLLGIISLPAVAGILTLSEQIITLIYQAPFWGAIKPLQVLAWVIILYFLNVPNVRMMLVFDKQDVINRYLVFSLLLNATLNIFLDPILGATGAAISRVCAVFILFILAHFYVNRVIYPNQALKYLIKPAIASSIMAVAVELISSFGIWIAIVIGIFSYLVLLYLFGCIKDVKEFVNSQSVALSET